MAHPWLKQTCLLLYSNSDHITIPQRVLEELREQVNICLCICACKNTFQEGCHTGSSSPTSTTTSICSFWVSRKWKKKETRKQSKSNTANVSKWQSFPACLTSNTSTTLQEKQNKKSNPCTPKMQMAPLDKRVSKHKTQGSKLKLFKIPWQGLMKS